MSDNSRKIIRLLADGVDPVTGEILPDSSPYNQPQIIRALFAVLEELDSSRKAKIKRSLPVKHGKPWTEEEKNQLVVMYKQGATLKSITEHFQRSSGAIRAELIKQGHLVFDGKPDVA